MKTYQGLQTILLAIILQVYTGHSQQLYFDDYDVPDFMERATSITRLSNDDLVMIGDSHKSTFGYEFFNYLHRTNANGSTQVYGYYKEINDKYFKWEDIASGEFGYFTVGFSYHPQDTLQLIVKINPDGTVDWARKIQHQPWQGEVSDPDFSTMSAICNVNDENFILGGAVSFSKENQKKYYAHFVMMDQGGQWHHSNLLDLTPHTDNLPYINKIVKVGNGFIATGTTTYGQDRGLLIIRLDNSLNVMWLKLVSSFGGSTVPTGLVADGSFDFLITGYSSALFIIKMNANGQFISFQDYKWPDLQPKSADIFLDASGEVYVTGSAYINKFFEGVDSDLFVMKIDPWGNVNGVRHYGRNGINEYTSSSVRLSNGLFAIHAETGAQTQRHLLSISHTAAFPCGEELIQVEEAMEDYIIYDIQVVQRESEIYSMDVELVVDEVFVNQETCGHTNPEELNLPNSRNIPSQNQNIEFAIYPNPTLGVIDVSWKSTKTSQIEKIEIYEITGKNIFSNEVKHLNQFRTVLPNSGMYIVALREGNGKVVSREKVIKY